MTTPQVSEHLISRPRNPSRKVPRWVEYAYYAVLLYHVMGAAWGVFVPGIAGGALLLLGGFCVVHQRNVLRTPAAYGLYCALSFLAIQAALHHEPLSGIRDLIMWMVSLIILQSLSLRPGFLHSFCVAVFIVGLITLPYLRIGVEVSEFQRASVEIQTLLLR